MTEDRQKVNRLKQSMKISRFEEINPNPFQKWQGDYTLGSLVKSQMGESRSYGWLDDLVLKTRVSLRVALGAL